MKKAFILASSAVLFAACQGGEPQLGKASIDKVLRAMTLELKPGESETITLHVARFLQREELCVGGRCR